MPSDNRTLTVGLELEMLDVTPEAAAIIERRSFRRHEDRSIRDADGAVPRTACELVTRPLTIPVNITTNTVSVETTEVRALVADLCKCAARVNVSCGLHVHVGRPSDPATKSKWSKEHVRTFAAIGLGLEDRLFALCPESRRNNEHARRIGALYGAPDLKQVCIVGPCDNRKYNNTKRYSWLNLTETVRSGDASLPEGRAAAKGLGTVEIRMLGNTKREKYISAWVSLWLKIAAYVAYMPPALALLSCVHSDVLAAELEAVKRAKEEPVNRRPGSTPQTSTRRSN